MTSNRTNLEKASALTEAFYVEYESERLVEACLTLEGVRPSAERDADFRARVRAKALDQWLRLLSIVDARVDPHFDRSKAPFTGVPHPTLPGGVRYPGFTDPAMIPDPAERAAYEDAIAKNNAENEYYEAQIRIHYVDELCTPRAERFIRDAFTSDPADYAELQRAIDPAISNAARKAALSKLLAPPRP